MNPPQINPKLNMFIETHQIIHGKRKTNALIIQRDGTLIVRMPLKASEKSIREFVEKSTRWIQEKQAQVRAAVPPLAKLAESALGNAEWVFQHWYREQGRQILSGRVRLCAGQPTCNIRRSR